MTFAYYKTWTIAGSADGSLTDYQVRVTVHKGAGTDSGEDVYLGSGVKDDLTDVRFFASDGVTALDYWRDQSTLVSGTSCVFWVEIPSIPASPSTVDVRIYYEDAAASDGSDIAATMLGGDDFRGMRYGYHVASGAAPRWSSGVQKMSNDDIYLTVWDSSTLQHWLYKTTDGGQTAPSNVSTIYAASSDRSHSNLATDGSTKFYATTKKGDGSAIYLKKSTNTGASWGSEVTIAGGLSGATDPCPVYISGSQLVVFVRVVNGANFEIRCYESTDDGASFSLKNTPHSEATSGIGSLEDIDAHILPSGRILIAWERETAEAGEARCDYIYTDDNCATYSTVATIVNSSGTVDDEGGSFAERADGTIDYYFGSNVGGGTSYKNQQVWVTTYDEGADSWSTPTLFNESYGGVENNAVYTSDGSLLFFCTRQYVASGGTASSYLLTSTRVPSGADDLSDRGWTQTDGLAYVLTGGLWVESWVPAAPDRAFAYLNTYSGQDAVIEALVSSPSPLTQVDLRIMFRYGSDADHYMLSLLKETTNQVIWYKRVSGIYTSLSTASFTPSVNTLYRVVITLRGVNPTTLTVTINGTTYLSSVTEGASSRSSGYIGLSASGVLARRATLARHIFARKYTANPPTISAWGSEVANGGPPTLSALTSSNITSTGARLTVAATGSGGTTLYLVTGPSSGWSDPIDTEIAAGQLAGGGAATWDNGGAAWTGSGQFADATGLTAGTAYKAAAVVYDSGTASYSNVVVSAEFTTTAQLVVADMAHGHTADAVILTSDSQLSVADALHGLTIDGLTLTADSLLTVAESTHAHTVDNITLSLAGSESLVVADAEHAHTVDALTLTADAYLTVADALHAHTVDNVVLSIAGADTLVVADSTHALTIDGLTLTAESVLAIQKALHAHTVDGLTLTLGGENLLIAEALHAHTVDGVALTVDAWLVVADATHAHTADNVTLDYLDTALVVLSSAPIGRRLSTALRTVATMARRRPNISTRTR